ncbi:DNA-binding response regulator [Alicyclobacillus curvatus]|nr:DNA-binding response regulator [Alicyclobacillus curvatus]
MDFTTECDNFIDTHRELRSGPRLQRLANGLGHGETAFLKNVWWPLFHHFDYLHPEYEVRDYRGGIRYVDFAYIEPSFRIAIEIDGITTHWREITQSQFFEHDQRQNMLIIDGWYVLRFTYDAIKEQPRVCQQTLQQLIGRWKTVSREFDELSIFERELVRFTSRSLKPVTPSDVREELQISGSYARLLLSNLTNKRWLMPASGQIRHRSYVLHPSHANQKL